MLLNKRQQDIPKEYLLCHNCEILFSGWEKLFSEQIFLPSLDKELYISSYKEWLSKFCASLSWRTLISIKRQNNNFNDESDYFLKQTNRAEAHLRDFLLGNTSNLDQYEQHIFPFTEIEKTPEYLNFPSNINRYFLRSIGIDVLSGDEDIYTFTKLPTFLIIGIISSKYSKQMRASRVALKQGILRPSNLVMPEYLLGYMKDKAREIQVKVSGISEDQSNKVYETVISNLDKAADSKSFQAIMHDYNIFGEKIFK
ncbi:hypothetical protein [Acinetobacter kyonggiensis]|uniref:Uncharacterized protein n=1 Tax=Acinetobacter kyonggiensis TaxID=595670 RepID=A0A1H3IUZ4_9GAMM|nr:hypothetical protein [Acinetobacter kyonggiensis]SDY31367.1 hypothetical protein SAMN05421643_107104 [Acinetobacter kyonggiensis]